MTERPSDELVGRMVAHFRAVVEKYKDVNPRNNAELIEARAIVAELPKPVDPDLVEAREICALAQHPRFSSPEAAESYRLGAYDSDTCVQHALAAIKRGSRS